MSGIVRTPVFDSARKSIEECSKSLAKIPVSTLSSEIAKVDPVTWGMKNRRIRGRRYSFWITEDEKKNKFMWKFHRPFLIKPLGDLRKYKAIEKSRQCGISENCLTETMWFADAHDDAKIIYTFPREKQIIRFVGTRVDPMLRETEYLKRLSNTGNRKSTFLKQIGNSYVIMESAWSEELGEGVDADLLILDEKDRMKPGVEFAFEESLSSSNYGWIRYISTPTIPNRGVDEYWKRSDQHIWLVRCEACGTWQQITYPDSFKQIKDYPLDAKIIPADSWQFVCKKCGRAKLDRWRGQWYCTKPQNKEIAGYHISQAMCVWMDCTELIQKMVKYRYKNIWYNYVMGQPYRSDDELISENDFDKCYYECGGAQFVTTRPKDIQRVAVGIDWGDISYAVVIGKDNNNKRHLLNLFMIPKGGGVLQDAVEIAKRIELFQPDIIIGDSGYGKDANAYMLKRYPGVFYAHYHPNTPRGNKIFNPIWNEKSDSPKVSTDRTLILKQVCHTFKQHDRYVVPDPKSTNEMISFVEHFSNLVLVIDEADVGKSEMDEFEVIESVGSDHFAYATAYAEVGLSRYDVMGGGFEYCFI